MKKRIVHIVDDASWGGVNRLLDCLESAGELALDQHRIARIERGQRKAPLIEADIIVSHMSICWRNLPFFSSLRATHPDTPLLHVEHSYSERYAALKAPARERFDDLLNLTYALFDKVVAVSGPQAAWINRRKFCQPDQLTTIASCVDLAPFRAIAAIRPEGTYKLGLIGRFHEQKGFDIVIRAFLASGRNDMHLVLIGDGPMKEELLALAEGNPNIIFKSATDKPAEAMAELDAVAMPSRWEPFGLVALEAMAAGRAVYCANVDGLKHHISSGAICIPENTVEGWRNFFTSSLCQRTDAPTRLSNSIASAEWEFINGWNQLSSDVTPSETAQKAA